MKNLSNIVVILEQIRAQRHRLLRELSTIVLGGSIMVVGTELPAAGDGVLCRFDFLIILRDALYHSTVRSVRMVLFGRRLSAQPFLGGAEDFS